MENINISQADSAVATMRTLPWLTTPSTAWLHQAVTARSVVAAPVQIRDRAISLSGVGSYRLGGDPISGVRSVITTDQAATLMWDACVDHKFSTSLGPSASPPV